MAGDRLCFTPPGSKSNTLKCFSLRLIFTQEHDIQAVAPKVLEVLSQRLQAEYMSIAEGEQHHPALHRIALLARKARDLMHSFPEVRE